MCGITAKGTKSIADALKVNITLEYLDLGWNDIGDKGFVSIAEALKSNYALKQLELGVTYSNGPALAEMLKVNMTLQTHDMSWNKFIPEGAKSIADALKVNRTLERLNLSCNTLGDTGVVHIAEALKSNNALQRLELAACGLTEKGLTVLSASLVGNDCLQYLDIATKSDTIATESDPRAEPLDCKSLKQFVLCLQENLHLTKLRLGPARDAPDRSDIIEDGMSSLNQV